jgi:hypothetical protein
MPLNSNVRFHEFLRLVGSGSPPHGSLLGSGKTIASTIKTTQIHIDE